MSRHKPFVFKERERQSGMFRVALASLGGVRRVSRRRRERAQLTESLLFAHFTVTTVKLVRFHLFTHSSCTSDRFRCVVRVNWGSLLLLGLGSVDANNNSVISLIGLQCQLLLGLESHLPQLLHLLGEHSGGLCCRVNAVGLERERERKREAVVRSCRFTRNTQCELDKRREHQRAKTVE